MSTERITAGRPRSSSRSTIEEAAAELFLEQSYGGTTVDEITQRAGVSRATFFNYFDAKSDLLWMDADRALDALDARLANGAELIDAVSATASEIGPERVPLAVTQAEVMGTGEELVSSGLVRVGRLVSMVRAAIMAHPPQEHDELVVAVRANVLAGALVAAWSTWIRGGVERRPLSRYLDEAIALVQL
ncbi:MAG: helix-turn-helix domain-containing protein [Terrimesophilobacter sp.]